MNNSLNCLVFAACLPLAACGTAGIGESADASTSPVSPTGKTFSVSGLSSGECADECPLPTDSTLAYQTPTGLRIGVAEVELLRSAGDPAPHRILAASPAIDADLVAGATFVAVDTGSIPDGTYTHLRVKLDWILIQVGATAHSASMSIPGTFDVDYALSNYRDPEQGARVQGDYLATFAAFGAQFPQTGVQSVAGFPPSYPNGVVDLTGDAYRITFAMPQGPVVIDQDAPASVDARLTYFIEDSFGWRDLAGPNYVTDVFDLAQDPTATEVPEAMAIRGFAIDVVEDEPAQTMTPVESCVNGDDDDDDGLIDCADPDCAASCSGDNGCIATSLGSALGINIATGITQGQGSAGGSCGGADAPEAVLGWTAPRAGTYLIDTTGSHFGTVVYARDGSCDGPELDCNNYASDGDAQVVLALSAGQTVVIYVDGRYHNSGRYYLSISLLD
jgi:hypothetical protein